MSEDDLDFYAQREQMIREAHQRIQKEEAPEGSVFGADIDPVDLESMEQESGR